jgi:hypothetical protein
MYNVSLNHRACSGVNVAMNLHVRIKEVSASNSDPTCINGRRLPKNVMPKDGKNSFSRPLPCPALYPTTAYLPMPQVNITPTFCGRNPPPSSST